MFGTGLWKVSIWILIISGVACLAVGVAVEVVRAPMLLTAAGLFAGAAISYMFLRWTTPLLDTAKEIQEASGYPATLRGNLQRANAQMAQAGQMMGAVSQGFQGASSGMAGGVDGTAVIKSSQDTGQQQNLNPVYQLELVVSVPNERPYELTTNSEVNTLAVAKCVPGTQVPVKVDPSNPSNVRVEWMKVVNS